MYVTRKSFFLQLGHNLKRGVETISGVSKVGRPVNIYSRCKVWSGEEFLHLLHKRWRVFIKGNRLKKSVSERRCEKTQRSGGGNSRRLHTSASANRCGRQVWGNASVLVGFLPLLGGGLGGTRPLTACWTLRSPFSKSLPMKAEEKNK